MKPIETTSLFAMAALWGGSFVFQRTLVPLLGPLPLTFLRLLFAGAVLIAVAVAQRRQVPVRSRFGILVVVALLTSAVPYSLFAFGAKSLSTALLSVLNATAPMFGAAFAAIWLRERLTPVQGLGLLLGAAGVGVVGEVWSSQVGAGFALAVLACLVAAACYGLSGIVIKRHAEGLSALDLALGGQALGALLLALPAASQWPAQPVPPRAFAEAAAFGVLCSALPFLLYTWLLARVGPTRALTVTFLIPVFGALWGWTLLREPLHPVQFVGGGVILLGTYLVARPGK